MKKKLLFAAIILTALGSCTESEFVGEQSLMEANVNGGAISFNLSTAAVTRADKTGSEAASDLSNQFIVYGEKDETDNGAAPAAGKLVFQNYKVAWTANSAYTTTSNTENWEYVGLQWTSDEQSHITTSTTDAQTIKYWDWGAASYTFTAVSAEPTDISSGYVTITKTTSATDGNKVYDKGYSVALTANADLDKLFFSERKVISNTNNTDRTQDNTYGGNVTFRFHNMASKVRVAMYENIPGHSVTINSFKVEDNASPTFATMTTPETGSFKANFVNNAKGTAGSMTVKYVASGTTVNYPTVSFTPTSTAANILTLGDQLKANVTIGESATGATYDKAEKAYTSVFPKEDNTQNLKLKVCYTLTAPVTGEKITVTDATAEIPAAYLKWKPGYAYTYIFKISDNTNGSTGTPGTNPAGLYPITFDAVEMIAEDGQAEYITTVSEPSITTFGAIYNGTKYTAYQTEKNEYQAQASPNRLDIFATFMEGSEVKTPTLGTSGAQHVNVYVVTTPDETNFPITEASVAEAIANPAVIATGVTLYTKSDETYTQVNGVADLTTGTTYYKKDANNVVPGESGYVETIAVLGTDYQFAKITATKINSDNTTYFSEVPEVVSNVPAEDGTTKDDIHALKLTGVKAGTYAIEYEASSAWTGDYKKVYKIIKVAAAE